jgi:sulfide:quinone oxidoreductase
VWAIGDVTQIKMANGAPFPKAGVFAEAQGHVVAANIVAEIRGAAGPGPAFDGKGYCFVETGRGEAFAVEGEFLATPAPSVSVAKPSAEAYEKKLAFERDRLKGWFDR